MSLICSALVAYYFVLFARIILSWVSMFKGGHMNPNPLVKVIFDLTEPVMSVFRRYIPPIGGLDLSPIFIFIILGLIQRGLGC